MALRKIVVEGDPVLKKKSRPVEKFDARLAELLDDMRQTLYSAEGVGLAAVQVGVLRRVVVVDVGDGLLELVNPEIIEAEGEQRESEGCLSLPGEYGETIRPAVVKVKAQNREGKWCIYKGDGLKARCFCHEIDHWTASFSRSVWRRKRLFSQRSNDRKAKGAIESCALFLWERRNLQCPAWSGSFKMGMRYQACSHSPISPRGEAIL